MTLYAVPANGGVLLLSPRTTAIRSIGTLRFYKQKLIFFVEAAGERPVGDLITLQIKLLLEHFRRERGWNIGNTNRFIVALKVVFNFFSDMASAEIVSIPLAISTVYRIKCASPHLQFRVPRGVTDVSTR